MIFKLSKHGRQPFQFQGIRLNKIVNKIVLFSNFLLSFFEFLLGFICLHIFGYWGKKKSYNNGIKKILICRNKYYASNNFGDSTEKHMVDIPLKKTGLDIRVFYWDYGQRIIGYQASLIKLLFKFQPDVVIFSSYSIFLLKRPPSHLWPILLRSIQKKVKACYLAVWYDVATPDFVIKQLAPTLDLFDFHLVGVSINQDKNLDLIPETGKSKLLEIDLPYPEEIFFPRKKDIEVVFLGQITSYRSNRRDYIFHLMKNNIPGVFSGFERESQPSYQEYQEILGRAKIGLNFSESSLGHQIKGRMFETMLSGALFLESKNPLTSIYFIEGIDYISFDSKDDLIDKIRYYLSHDEEREEIASNGRNKILTQYSGEIIWKGIIERCSDVQSRNHYSYKESV
ncbi:MAG: hypothetical protein CMG75_06465 [Candidatus Marinimicrobia bacterium]|nr:hypothetical protein [Candidatus Neomarinimicrobiota bacterium]|tara:strand:+ start:8021 stop:9211 length:1191 start_codon:yes stop_codon:yes gene_type:complete